MISSFLHSLNSNTRERLALHHNNEIRYLDRRCVALFRPAKSPCSYSCTFNPDTADGSRASATTTADLTANQRSLCAFVRASPAAWMPFVLASNPAPSSGRDDSQFQRSTRSISHHHLYVSVTHLFRVMSPLLSPHASEYLVRRDRRAACRQSRPLFRTVRGVSLPLVLS